MSERPKITAQAHGRTAYGGLSDRTQWDKGPWDQEPDALLWETPEGVPCFLRRNTEVGHWCGYVGVRPDHPALKDKQAFEALEVHGGITFQGPSEFFIAEGFSVPPGLHWVGFDCFHAYDGSPLRMLSRSRDLGAEFGGGYRTLEYAFEQCEFLSRQLRAMPAKESVHG